MHDADLELGGVGAAPPKHYSTDDTQQRPPVSEADGAWGNREQSWVMALQILILALLLGGLYLTDNPRMGYQANRVDQHPTFSFSKDLTSAHHKTTTSWSLHVLDQRMGWIVGGGGTRAVMEKRDAYLAACTTKLVDRHPLTSWDQAMLQARAYYEAERGTGHGSTVDQLGQEPADSEGEGKFRSRTWDTASGHVLADLETPGKRRRMGAVGSETQQRESRRGRG